MTNKIWLWVKIRPPEKQQSLILVPLPRVPKMGPFDYPCLTHTQYVLWLLLGNIGNMFDLIVV